MEEGDEQQCLINAGDAGRSPADLLLDAPAKKFIIFAVIPMFMGYASLVSFQSDVKDRIGIQNESSADSYAFGEAVSSLFLAALVFRLLHNIIFSWLVPRQRVFLACGLMFVATGGLTLVYYGLQWRSIGVAFVIYICGGIAIGTFEANIVSCITPLGHQTKKWALMGMPVGYNGVSIGGFFLFALAPSNPILQGCVFGGTSVLCLGSAVVFAIAVPHDMNDTLAKGTRLNGVASIGELVGALREWKVWVRPLWRNFVALFVDMFACILASTVALYVFKVGDVPLYPNSTSVVPYNIFQGIFNVCGFLGDFTARIVAYSPPHWWPTQHVAPDGNPSRILVLTVVGLALCFCKVAFLAPLGMLFIMFGNGLIYATTTHHIDTIIPWKFNVISISSFLFTGDCGSYIASTLTTPISNAIGKVGSH